MREILNQLMEGAIFMWIRFLKQTLQAYTNRSRIQGGVSRKSIKESYGKNVVYRQASFLEE